MINLRKRLYSKGNGTKIVSQRSGLFFDHADAVREPGTDLIMHKRESDGQWNSQDWNGSDPVVSPDNQKIKFVCEVPVGEQAVSLFLLDKATGETLYTNDLEEDGVLVEE